MWFALIYFLKPNLFYFKWKNTSFFYYKRQKGVSYIFTWSDHLVKHRSGAPPRSCQATPHAFVLQPGVLSLQATGEHTISLGTCWVLFQEFLLSFSLLSKIILHAAPLPISFIFNCFLLPGSYLVSDSKQQLGSYLPLFFQLPLLSGHPPYISVTAEFLAQLCFTTVFGDSHILFSIPLYQRYSQFTFEQLISLFPKQLTL